MPVEGKEIRVDNPVKLFDRTIGWLVGQSRDYFTKIDNGINVSNSCGSWMVYTK